MMISCLVGRKLCFSPAIITSVLTLWLFGLSILQVCPVCAKRVGMDIVSHITKQHGNFFKISFFI